MAPGLVLDHLALPIFDVAASYAFYTEVLGLSLLGAHRGCDWGGMPWLMLTFGFADGKTLALCALRGLERPREGRMPRDARHFAFACAGDAELSAWKQRLRAANVSFWEEDHGTQRSIYFEDPNGIVLEVTTPARPALPDPSAERVLRAWLSESASQ